jgi:tight adherence protein B
MRRFLAVGTCALLLAAVLPLTVAGAQESTEEEATSEGTSAPPATLRIESVDVNDYPQVTTTVSVTAHPDGPLPAGSFTVREAGEMRPADVAYAESADLQVMLLVDTTGSMGGAPMTAAKRAATTFVNRLPDEVSIAIVGYEVEATVLTDFSASRDEHLDGIDEMVADGRTAMYDAVLTSAEVFSDTPDASQVIVLLTDGEDNASERSVEEAVDALQERDITLHSVEYLTAFTEGDGIRTMANATGGAVLRADDADALAAVYEQLAADLVSRYRVSFTSEASGRVDLDVEVDHDGVQATGRRTVTMPAPEDEPVEVPDDEEEPEAAAPALTEAPITPPAEGFASGRIALIAGLTLWFLALAITALVLLAPRQRRAQLAGASRELAGARGQGVSNLADRATLFAERRLEKRGHRGRLNAALERAGIDLRPGEFLVLVLCAAITAAILGALVQGPVLALVFVAVALIGSRLTVSMMESRRQASFAAQLGETLQLLTGGLRAGYSLMQAVDAVAREADAPAADEFARLVVETRLGRDMHDSLTAMAERTGSVDFEWVVQAIQIHREVGGDLAEVLDTVAGTIRERDHVRRQVKALSAEGRISGVVLILLPFAAGLGLYLMNPGYIGELFTNGLLGWGLIGVGVALMVVGALWMKKLVRLVF